MKRVLFVFLLLLAGCVVQSFGPFCTDKSMIYLKDVIGEWTLQQDFGDDVSTNSIPPWVFSGGSATNCELVAFDKNNVAGTFEVRFFKLGNNVFVDVSPGDPDDQAKINSYWKWTIRATHTICKVEIQDDNLTLKSLDYDWLQKNLKQHKFSLPYLTNPDGFILLTASPKQWEVFLSKQAANPEAFVPAHAFVLKRNKSVKP